MIPVARSWWNAPTIAPVFANLNELARLGMTVHDLRLRHRKADLADVEERMAEGVDAVAVDVRHRAGRRHVEVAVEEHRADRIARAEARFRLRYCCRLSSLSSIRSERR